jgi:hypothetical protein
MLRLIRVWPKRTFSASAVLLAVGLALAACSSGPTTTPQPTSGTAGQPLFIQADTVVGGVNLASTESSCVQISQFQRNEEIVWRAKVFDPVTGQALDDTSLASVVVQLPDQNLTMKYGGHPHSNPTDQFWTVSFTIPADYPTGALPYTVAATGNDGRTGTFDQLNSAPSLLTITSTVHPVVTPAPTGS